MKYIHFFAFLGMLFILDVLYKVIDFLLNYRPDWLVYYNKPIETISYIAVICSVIFVAYQAWMFRKDYKRKKEVSEFDKSYELAHYYATDILPHISAINFLFDKIGIPIYSDVYIRKCLEFHDFTYSEACDIFSEKIFKEYITDFGKPIPTPLLIDFFSKYYGETQNGIMQKFNITFSEFDRHKRLMFYQDLTNKAYDCISDTLNNLEYFSMYFCSKLAISENIYMSIHQTFIRFVNNVYIIIAIGNNHPGHEYYTHVTYLRNLWMKMFKEQTKEEYKVKGKISKLTKEADGLKQSMHSKPKKIHQD